VDSRSARGQSMLVRMVYARRQRREHDPEATRRALGLTACKELYGSTSWSILSVPGSPSPRRGPSSSARTATKSPRCGLAKRGGRYWRGQNPQRNDFERPQRRNPPQHIWILAARDGRWPGRGAAFRQTCIQFNCPFWTSTNLAPIIVPTTSLGGRRPRFLSQWQKIRARPRPATV
jgi:hypothetical protein